MSEDIRRSFRCLALAALAVASVAARVEAAGPITTIKPGTLQVCLYAGFAPFADKDDEGNWQGWDVDYLNDFAKKNGFKEEDGLYFVPVERKTFEGIWLGPGQGSCDIAATGISDTADRRKATAQTQGKIGCWSKTYYGVLRTFLVRTSEYAGLTDVRGLAGKTAIVTKGSTANTDLCYRMRLADLHPCKKYQDHPCDFEGLEGFTEMNREEDGSCVDIEYPQCNDERNAAIAVANMDKKNPSPPFTYGGGYGSIQTLVCNTQGNNLALVWPHCNMGSDFQEYSEPFSFVVRAASTGLLERLNEHIAEQPYPGTAIPDLNCKTPPWTTAKQPSECSAP